MSELFKTPPISQTWYYFFFLLSRKMPVVFFILQP